MSETEMSIQRQTRKRKKCKTKEVQAKAAMVREMHAGRWECGGRGGSSGRRWGSRHGRQWRVAGGRERGEQNEWRGKEGGR